MLTGEAAGKIADGKWPSHGKARGSSAESMNCKYVNYRMDSMGRTVFVPQLLNLNRFRFLIQLETLDEQDLSNTRTYFEKDT